MRRPRVTIITPCYQAADTMQATLRSVAGQTHRDIEHIIVDGASTDGTAEIAAGFDHVAEIISEPDAGQYDALNKGLELGSGDIFGTLNADDVYATPTAIEQVVGRMYAKRADCAYANLDYVDGEGTVVRRWPGGIYRRDKLERGWAPPHPTFFATNRLTQKLGPYDTRLEYSADYEWMLRALLIHEAEPVYIPETLVHMRIGGRLSGLRARIKAHLEDRRAWKLNGRKPPKKMVLKPISKLPQWILA